MSAERKFQSSEVSIQRPKKSKKSWKAVTSGIKYYEEVGILLEMQRKPRNDSIDFCINRMIEAFSKGKYGKALALLFKYEDVEARAMFLLACMYSKGLGVIENMKTATSYLLKLVDFQDIRPEEENLLAMAHYYLGDLYYRGIVVKTDEDEAEKHWRRGAVLNKDPETGRHYFGTMKCQTALGMFYSSPKMKNTKKAFYWHRKAAESGSIISAGALGVMYMYGIGTDENINLAYDHLTSAAAMDNIYAKGYLTAFYYKRQMYHSAVTLGKELAEMEDYELLAKMNDCNADHVKQGVAIGCFYLALCIQYGYTVEKNIPEAKKLIKKALEISTSFTCDLHVNAILGLT